MEEAIEKAAEVIQNGGVILYPTDTIWGLGCDPKNEEAIEKIFALKQRDLSKSLILLVPDERLLQRYAKIIPDVCYDLIDMAVKPLTVVYPEGQHVSKKVMGADGSIAIRLTKDSFCTRLMRKTKCGIVSTSANVSSQPYENDFEKIPESIKKGVDYIVDLPLATKNAPPSQIIKIAANSEVTIIRK